SRPWTPPSSTTLPGAPARGQAPVSGRGHRPDRRAAGPARGPEGVRGRTERIDAPAHRRNRFAVAHWAAALVSGHTAGRGPLDDGGLRRNSISCRARDLSRARSRTWPI